MGALKLRQTKSGIFVRPGDILRPTLVMDSQLFTSQNTILRIASEFEPKGGSGGMIAAAFGKHREVMMSARAKFGGQTQIERLRARDVGAIGIAPPFEESRKAEKIEAVDPFAVSALRREKRVDLGKESCKAPEVHLIVAQHAYKWIRRAAAEVVEVILRDHRGSDIVLAVPAEARRVENLTFQLDEANGAKAKLPESPRGMKKIDVRGQTRRGDGARHRESAVEQRPVEGFAVESDQHRALRDAHGKLLEQRVFFGKVAHEKLFDLQRAGIPPG